MHILETVYFTVIFILRSIHELADLARITANRCIYMVLQTIACWVDAVVYRCFFHHAIQQGRFDIDLVKNNIALRSLVLVYVLVKSYRDFPCYISDVDSSYYYRNDDTEHLLLPESYRRACCYNVLDKAALPRRHREETEWYEEALPIQSLIEAAKQRTWRLLRSFSELEREVW